MIAITMTAYRRPSYTRQALEALSKTRGIENCVFFPQVEPVDETVACFDGWTACEIRLERNHNRLGLNRNTHKALSRARNAKASKFVHLEDDTVPSPDALEYFDEAWRILAADPKHTILLATAYNKTGTNPRTIKKRPIWTPWMWGVDDTRLRWLLVNWCFRNPKCFTCRFKDTFRRTRSEIYPELSRVQNIGYEQGENNRTSKWYRDHHRSRAVSKGEKIVEWVLTK